TCPKAVPRSILRYRYWPTPDNRPHNVYSAAAGRRPRHCSTIRRHCMSAPESAPTPDPAAAPLAGRTPTRVAVIDDEQDMRASISQWLSLSGFQPETFGSAEEALGVLGADFPGIVVSD